MRSSASIPVLLFLVATPLPAQQRPAAAVPPALAAAVAAAIASQWDVEPARLVLEWGAAFAAESLGVGAETPFRLLGGSREGWFAVVFERRERPPVATRVRAGVVESLDVARRPLTAGSRISPADVRREARVAWGPPSARQEPGVEAGWIVRRAVAEGTVVEPPMASPPSIVAAGSSVRLIWTRGAVSVAVDATALHDAALGAPILVRVPGRRGQLRGTVAGPGLVSMSS
jgi:flagella basal body P-ring formation protein FlgA